MKKVLAILLAAMMLLSLAACTNNDDNPSGSENNPGTSQSDNQGGTENQGGESTNNGGELSLDNITDANYAEIVRKLFGIDVVPGDGWELKKAESTGTLAGGIGIVYQGSSTVDTKEMMKKYYDATAAVSTDGIRLAKIDGSFSDQIADFDTFYENETSARGAKGDWSYEFDGNKIKFMFALSPDMELTITIDYVAEK